MPQFVNIEEYDDEGNPIKKKREMSDAEVIRRIIGLLGERKYIPWLIALGCAIAVGTWMGFWRPLVFAALIRDGLGNGDITKANKAMIFYWGKILAVTILIGYTAWISQQWVIYYLSVSVMYEMRERIFANLQRLSFDFYDSKDRSTGKIISYITSDVETIQELIGSGLLNTVGSFVQFVGALFFMFAISVELSLTAMGIIGLITVLGIFVLMKARKYFVIMRRKVAAVLGALQENISGIRIIKQFAVEGRIYREFDRVTDEELEINLRVQKLFSALPGLIMMVLGSGLGIILLVGIYIHTPLDTMFAFILYLIQFFAPIAQIIAFINQIQNSMAAGERIIKLIDMEPAVIDKPVSIGLTPKGRELARHLLGNGNRPPRINYTDPKKDKKIIKKTAKLTAKITSKHRNSETNKESVLNEKIVRALITAALYGPSIGNGSGDNDYIYFPDCKIKKSLAEEFRERFPDLIKFTEGYYPEATPFGRRVYFAGNRTKDAYRIFGKNYTDKLLKRYGEIPSEYLPIMAAICRYTVGTSEHPICAGPLSKITGLKKEEIERLDVLYPELFTVEKPIRLKDIKGHLEFRNVYFEYVPNVPVIKNLNMEIKPKERAAIVGYTGAGKSTLINLLGRFYDVDSGAILVDGYDIRDIEIQSFRKMMGIVLQDNFLFSGSILDNIRYGKPDATEADVVAAAKKVGAHEFITELPRGYLTEVEERGTLLSVGQKQLIAFARALISDPPILILDEATSAVDPYSELIIQKALEVLLRNRTSISIAHRLSTIINSDVIFVMDGGRIVEKGDHYGLLAEKGLYYRLYALQYREISEKDSELEKFVRYERYKNT